MITRVSLALFFTLNISMAFSQAAICDNKLDTAAVIRTAKRRHAYLAKQYPPAVQFDGKNCEWTVQSSGSRHTNKGKCRYTNGCTEVISVRLVIDATTGKVKTRTKEKQLYHNYE